MKRHHLFSLLICISLMFSCGNQDSKLEDADNLFKFRDYISYTSTGLQSIADPIIVNLSTDVKGWEAGQIISEALLSIKPHVEGELKAANAHTLVFTPDEYLDPATEYSVSVKLSDIYKAIPSAYSSYTFQFKTISPNFSISTTDLQSYSKQWQYLGAVMKSADVMALEDAKTLVSASQDGKKLKLQWNEINGHSKYFEFKIDSIHRTIENTDVLISWDGSAIDSDNIGQNKVTIPGINNFTIVNLETIKNPEQSLSINFSDPLKPQQNFDGLVTIQGVKTPKFVVDGNILKVYPDVKLVGNIQVDVFTGISNTDGYKLKKPFSEVISFEDVKPMVRLISNGTILPNSEQLKFNFEAVNLSAVDVRIIKIYEDNILQFLQDNPLNSNNENDIKRVGRRIAKQTIQLQTAAENFGKWKAYSIDLSKFFKADAGAIYRVELSFNKNYALYDCDANAASTENQEDNYEDYYDEEDYYNEEAYTENLTEDENLKEEAYWDNRIYNYRNYHYNWREQDNPCHDAYYNQNRIVAQNLIASNLGVIAKKGANNDYYFAVTNILSTNPETGVKIKLYNFQQQEIGSVSTDTEGLATFKGKNFASFAVVSKGKNTTYLRLTDGNSLSLSKFDVSGNQLQQGLKGYIYGERGVWRPGDTLFLTFMLNDKDNPLPKDHPVKMEVTDPNGKLIYKNVTSHQLNKVLW
ncbi:MG2 domain-containing protein [Sediminibacter sp. Hel_I_10]|uniref:MG2 domain-containing protein n=1 Tax=Sediminibacter sp. Hel_I_10 TaxID=1392490 RepID=UPI0009DCE291|nr:MG2 domain-containing protein [Sediminibacter sp. Hel_I_10]